MQVLLTVHLSVTKCKCECKFKCKCIMCKCKDEISGSVSVTYSASMQAGAIYVMALQPGVSDETSQDREK